MPDKEKINRFANMLLDITSPALTNIECRQIADECMKAVYDAANNMKEKARSL